MIMANMVCPYDYGHYGGPNDYGQYGYGLYRYGPYDRGLYSVEVCPAGALGLPRVSMPPNDPSHTPCIRCPSPPLRPAPSSPAASGAAGPKAGACFRAEAAGLVRVTASIVDGRP